MRSLETASESSDMILFNKNEFSQNYFVALTRSWKIEKSWFGPNSTYNQNTKNCSKSQQMLANFILLKEIIFQLSEAVSSDLIWVFCQLTSSHLKVFFKSLTFSKTFLDMNPWFDQKLVLSKRLLGVNSWSGQKLVFSKGS